MPFSIRAVRTSALLATGIAIAVALSPFGLRIEREALDVHSRLLAPDWHNQSVILVGLDDISFDLMSEELGGLSWPYPRAVHAQVIQHLIDAGASRIFLDFLFDLESGHGAADDKALARVLSRAPVYLAAEDSAQAVSMPLNLFLDSGARAVNASLPFDVDGQIRWAPSGIELPGNWAAGFRYIVGAVPQHAYQSDLPSVAEALYKDKNKLNIPQSGGLLSFPSAGSRIERLSFYEVYQADLFEALKDKVRGKSVFIGSTPSVSITPEQNADMYFTPQGVIPGVEIHAYHLASLESGQLRNVLHGWPIPLVLIFWTALQLWASLSWSKPARGFCFSVTLALIWECAVLVFWYRGVLVPIVLPQLITAFCYVGSLFMHYVRERDARLLTKAQLFRYLPARVAEHVMKNPSRLAMAGDRSRVTLLFGDLAGFTTLSEQESPERVLTLLQDHLGAMAETIFKYEGTLDKYLGDGIMAFWGAPEAQPNHASLALQAAVEMIEKVAAQNVLRAAEGLPQLELRIGLHSGEAIVGNIGSNLFIDYTAIGDVVNTAARLEGANKNFGTSILLSAQCVDHFICPLPQNMFLLGRIAVKGKNEAIAVYTVVGDSAELEDFVALQGVLAYLDADDYEGAGRGLLEILERAPHFGPAKFHLEQLQEFKRPFRDSEGYSCWVLNSK